MNKPQKLFRCPVCGNIITEDRWLEDMKQGGNGYCACEFMTQDENGDVFFPRIYHEYDVYALQSSEQKARNE